VKISTTTKTALRRAFFFVDAEKIILNIVEKVYAAASTGRKGLNMPSPLHQRVPHLALVPRPIVDAPDA
jgi:hypothetical protein